MKTAVLLPVLNESATLAGVLADIPRDALGGGPVVVCDNRSTDDGVAIARAHGAVVVHAPRRGYGSAVQAGLTYLRSRAGGESKISGSVRGAARAGVRILWAVWRYGADDTGA